MKRTLLYMSMTLLLGIAMIVSGCGGTTKAQQNTSTGIAIGTVAGGVLSGDLGGAAVGAAIGGGLGYIIGNEQDKKIAEKEAKEARAALEKAKVSGDPATAHRPANKNAFVGSTWRVISLVSEEPLPDYHAMVVSFQTNYKVTTLTALKNGETSTITESYRFVDDVLIISGKDYVVNAKYTVAGKQMSVVAPGFEMVLEEVEEEI